MNLEVSHLALKSAIKMLSIFVNNAEKDEHKYVSIYYSAGKGQLELKAGSDVGIGRIVIPNVSGEMGDMVVVGAEQFFNVIKGAYSDIRIEHNSTKDYVTIAFGKSRYKIPVLPDDIAKSFISLFDNERKLDMKPTAVIDCERFKHKIKCISHCLSTDDGVPELQSIYIHNENLIATDSIVGGKTTYDGISKLSGNSFSRMPISFVDAISTDKIGIRYDTNGIIISGDRKEYLASGMFALNASDFSVVKLNEMVEDYRTQKNVIEVVFSPVGLADALSRLSVLNDDTTQGVEMLFNPENDYCELTVNNHNFEGYERVHIVYNIKPSIPYRVKVDGKQLLKSAKVLNGDCYFSSESEDDVQYLSDIDTVIFFYALQ